MDVNGISSTTPITSSTPAPLQAPDADDLPGATQTSISREGDLFGQLASLSQSDPGAFKQVASEISQKLEAEAAQATGDRAQFLSKLADRFGQAAQTGDMSALKPDGAQGAHKHHHHGHQASSASSGSAQQQPLESLSQIIESSLEDVTGTTSAAS